MRSVIVMSALWLVSACGGATNDFRSEPESEASVVDMLSAGDTKVCIDEMVKDTLLSTGLEDGPYAEWVAKPDEGVGFSAVNAKKVDKNLKEIICQANLLPRQGMSALIQPLAVEYAVRPSLDEEGFFVVEVDDVETLAAWVLLWTSEATRLDRKASALSSSAPSQELHQQSTATPPAVAEQPITEDDIMEANLDPDLRYRALDERCRDGSAEACKERDAMEPDE